MGAQAALLAGAKRLHLQHGPIDLVIQADGSTDQVRQAYRQATLIFDDVLQVLVDELTGLRQPVSELANKRQHFSGPVAVRMMRATSRYATCFVTPMAAVAGAVADYVLEHMVIDLALKRAWVNNGGDIAWYLEPGASLRAAMVDHPGIGHDATRFGTVKIQASDPPRGLATSGWRGRSHSLGIADAVTVLAHDAAAADVAATLIANTVDLPGSTKVTREKACRLKPDSDLGERLVTTDVAALTSEEIERALLPATAFADQLIAQGLIHGAVLNLQGVITIFGDVLSRPPKEFACAIC